jgi:hypothetical protein
VLHRSGWELRELKGSEMIIFDIKQYSVRSSKSSSACVVVSSRGKERLRRFTGGSFLVTLGGGWYVSLRFARKGLCGADGLSITSLGLGVV